MSCIVYMHYSVRYIPDLQILRMLMIDIAKKLKKAQWRRSRWNERNEKQKQIVNKRKKNETKSETKPK